MRPEGKRLTREPRRPAPPVICTDSGTPEPIIGFPGTGVRPEIKVEMGSKIDFLVMIFIFFIFLSVEISVWSCMYFWFGSGKKITRFFGETGSKTNIFVRGEQAGWQTGREGGRQ